MLYLSKCINEYKRFFPEDWIEEYRGNQAKGLRIIFEYAAFCFDNLTRSMLSGEYVLEKEEICQALDQYQKLLNHEAHPDSQVQILTEGFSLLENSVIECIDAYRCLICIYENKFEDASIESFSTSHDVFSKEKMSRPLNLIIDVVFPLVEIEYTLSVEARHIIKLFNIRQLLNERKREIADELYQALMDKAAFLSLKLQHVKEKKTIVLHDSLRYEIKAEDLYSEKLASLEDSFYGLYKKASWKDFFKKNCASLKEKFNKNEVTLSELVILMRFYQKTAKNHLCFDSVITKFNNIHIENAGLSFNRYSLNVLKNYMYNSRFSLMLASNCKLQEFKDALDEIEELQEETDIRNFHPYKKALEYLRINYLDKFENVSIDELSEAYILFGRCFNYFRKNVKWCFEHDFLAFQFPFEDSLIKYGRDFVVFYPSSFSRPIDYDKLKVESAEFSREYNRFNMQVFLSQSKQDILKRLNTVKDKADEKLEDTQSFVRKRLEEESKKYVKSFGLYTTVVTFLFGAINIFPKSTTFEQSLMAVLGIGIVLFMFANVIYFLTISEDKNTYKNPVTFFFGLTTIIFLLLMIYMLFHFQPWRWI